VASSAPTGRHTSVRSLCGVAASWLFPPVLLPERQVKQSREAGPAQKRALFSAPRSSTTILRAVGKPMVALQKSPGGAGSVAPLGLWSHHPRPPTTHAVGYRLSALRAWSKGTGVRRRSSPPSALSAARREKAPAERKWSVFSAPRCSTTVLPAVGKTNGRSTKESGRSGFCRPAGAVVASPTSTHGSRRGLSSFGPPGLEQGH
jgi:hypothetical protein